MDSAILARLQSSIGKSFPLLAVHFQIRTDYGCRGEPIPKGIPPPDIILAADCVYFEPAFPLLVQTLCDLSPKGSNLEILFCYKKRRKVSIFPSIRALCNSCDQIPQADKRFFGMLKKKFRWEEVMDDPCREIYSRDAVTLLRLYRI